MKEDEQKKQLKIINGKLTQCKNLFTQILFLHDAIDDSTPKETKEKIEIKMKAKSFALKVILSNLAFDLDLCIGEL